jgi:hypothetical protein
MPPASPGDDASPEGDFRCGTVPPPRFARIPSSCLDLAVDVRDDV